jgi:Na+-translocating ferredoxin:NAD+ oxidoreductase RNF subunit RnfB
MIEIIFAVTILGLLGLLFGLGLAFASKKFSVHIDPKLEQVQHLLPGGNCGACGNPGCFGFAESLLKGKNSVGDCRVCSEEIKEKIAAIMGVSLEKQDKKIATLHCNGGSKVKDKYLYDGVNDCVTANLVLGGQKSCVFACLGLGTCVKACPFGAITMSAEGLPVVDKDKCRSCNRCVLACPKKLFSLVSQSRSVYVGCSSHDAGRDVKAVCPVGCIACRLCEKACKFDAIHVIDNLAVIDYSKCTSCGECVKVCPSKTILIR